MPFVEGIWRLYVVMPINKQSGTPSRMLPSRIDERMTRRREDPDMVEANTSQMLRKPIRAIPYVAFVSRLSADRREADEVLQFRQKFFAVSAGVGESARRRHDSPASLKDQSKAVFPAGIEGGRRLAGNKTGQRDREVSLHRFVVVTD